MSSAASVYATGLANRAERRQVQRRADDRNAAEIAGKMLASSLLDDNARLTAENRRLREALHAMAREVAVQLIRRERAGLSLAQGRG